MRTPKYRFHRATGQAVVTINGKDIYLGQFDSPESQIKYHQVLSLHLSSGGPPLTPTQQRLITVREAFGRYRDGCAVHVSRPEERWHFMKAVELVVEVCGDRLLSEFGPLVYRLVQDQFVSLGWSRNYVNKQTGKVKLILRWLVSQELYSASKLADIREVPDLRRGKTSARETQKVGSVEDAVVLATLPHLPKPVQGLVLFQWWTGCRPGEAIKARREDINTEGIARLPKGKVKKLADIWVYQPPEHKGSWAGRDRYVLIGPQGQKELAEFLEEKNPSDYLFSPRGVEKASRAGEVYQASSYTRRVAIAAKKAGVAHWFPYQLRHRFAARIRDHFSENHAKEVLGHSHLEMTDHYCGIGLEKAAEAIRQIG